MEIITLNNNALRKIKYMFKMSNSSKLKHLSLNNNQINYISENAFNKTKLLESLDLSNNKIKILHNVFKESLKHLKQLDLSNNPVDLAHDFVELEKLQVLNLNKIKSLNITNGFYQNEELTSLNLRGNNIKSISADLIPHHYNLKLNYLDLSNNRIVNIHFKYILKYC